MRKKRRRATFFQELGVSKEMVTPLKLVILAVAFGTVCFNITGGVAMTGYLKLLGVSDFTYGLILAIGPVTTVLQIFASYLLERTRKRKFMFMFSGILQRAAWLPFGLVPFIFPMSAEVTRIWMAVLFLLISSVNGPFINVSFLSFITDLIPIHIRGRYFSFRSRIATVFGIAGGLLTAFLLDRFTGFTGYALVFSIAAVFGITDILFFIFIKFPPMHPPEKKESAHTMIAGVFKNKRYMKIIAFITFWMFSVHISNPFYLVYAKTVLNLSNTAITIIMSILPSICMVTVLQSWGRALDKYGNKPVMIISSRLICIAPFIWFFTVPGELSIVPIIIICVSGGFLGAGLDFGAQNIYLNQSPDKNRSMYLAVYSCVTSLIGMGLANTAGGWLLDNALPALEKLNLSFAGIEFNRYNYLFLITSVLRVFAAFVLLPRLIEEEDTTPVKTILRNAFNNLRRRAFVLVKSK